MKVADNLVKENINMEETCTNHNSPPRSICNALLGDEMGISIPTFAWLCFGLEALFLKNNV